MAVCKACGADLSNRPHYPWCPNAGWVPWDQWLEHHDGYARVDVDNGRGVESRGWSAPTREQLGELLATPGVLHADRRW